MVAVAATITNLPDRSVYKHLPLYILELRDIRCSIIEALEQSLFLYPINEEYMRLCHKTYNMCRIRQQGYVYRSFFSIFILFYPIEASNPTPFEIWGPILMRTAPSKLRPQTRS